MPNRLRVYTAHGCLGMPKDEFCAAVQIVAFELRNFMYCNGAEAYVVRGASGVVFGGALMMYAPDIQCIVARKPGENSHNSQISAAGGVNMDVKRYVVLDDFISSGATVRGIEQDMGSASLVGVFCYQHAARSGFNPRLTTFDRQGKTMPMVDFCETARHA